MSHDYIKSDNPKIQAHIERLERRDRRVEHFFRRCLHLLEQAGYDVTQLAIIPALKEAHKKLTEEIIPAIVEDLKAAIKAGTEWLLEKLGEAFDALVEALVEAVKKYAPEVADAVYDYLYNNPEEVIAFFQTYGPEMLDLVEEYGDEALMEGHRDPFNRRPFPWGREDWELQNHFRRLGRLRKEHEALRLGDIRFFAAEDKHLGFTRTLGDRSMKIYVNRSGDPWEGPAGKVIFGWNLQTVAADALTLAPRGFCLVEE